MLTTIDDKTLLAVVTQQVHNPEFKVFVEYLEAEQKNLAAKSIVRKDKIECRWLQGAAQIFSELIYEIKAARGRFEKIQKRKKI